MIKLTNSAPTNLSYTWEGTLPATDGFYYSKTVTITHPLGVIPERISMIHQWNDGSWGTMKMDFYHNRWWTLNYGGDGNPLWGSAFNHRGYIINKVTASQVTIQYFTLYTSANFNVKITVWA